MANEFDDLVGAVADDELLGRETPNPGELPPQGEAPAVRIEFPREERLLGDLGHVCECSRVGAEVDWAAVPADLVQAVMLLAAEFYEARIDDGTRGPGLPVMVQSLIERWRIVRVLGGGEA